MDNNVVIELWLDGGITTSHLLKRVLEEQLKRRNYSDTK